MCIRARPATAWNTPYTLTAGNSTGHVSWVDCHTPDPPTVPTLPATAEFAVEIPVPSLNLACSSSDDGKGAAATLALHSREYDAATSLAENARPQMRTSSMEVAVCSPLYALVPSWPTTTGLPE